MTRKKMENSGLNGFENALELLEAYVKLLRSVKAEASRVDDLGRLTIALRRLTPSQQAVLLAPHEAASPEARKQPDDWLTHVVADFTHDQIEAYLADRDITRTKLQQIATWRFGMSKGSIRSLPKEALLEKLRTLVQHESTHESIARAASGGGPDPQGDSVPQDGSRARSNPDSTRQDGVSDPRKDSP